MIREEQQKVEDGQNPDIQRMEDTRPIQIDCLDEIERPQKEEKIVSDLMSTFDKWDAWRRPYENLWNQIYRLYFSVAESAKTTTRAKVFVPIIFQVIEAAIPKIMNVIFGQEEFFDVIPDNKADNPIADVIKILLNYQLMQADFFVKFMDFCKQLLLYGTSYFLIYWKTTRKWVYTRTPIRKQVTLMGIKLGEGKEIVGWHEKKEYKVVERRPELDLLDILDVFPDPNAMNEKDGKGLFIRSWIEKEELKDLGKGKYPVYDNTEDPGLDEKSVSINTARQTRLSTRGVTQPVEVRTGQVELLTYWGMYDLDGDGIREECQIVIGNRNTLLKAQSNPFHHQKRPIVRSVLYPLPNEWYGIGLVEPVISLVHELNTLRRQHLDNVNLAINRMWKVLSYADVDLDTLVSTPNGIIITDDMNAVEMMPVEMVTQDSYATSQIVQNDIENTTAPKSLQGTPESGKLGRTARGAQLIIGQALEKFGTAVKLIEESCVKRVLRMFHQLNLQFIDDDDTLRDPGLYGSIFDQQVTPEMIRAEVKFKMLGISEIVNKEAKINQLTTFLGIFKNVLSPETITDIAKKIFRLMGFNDQEITLQGAPPPPGSATGPTEQALTNQAGTNPPGAPPSVPGVGQAGGSVGGGM